MSEEPKKKRIRDPFNYDLQKERRQKKMEYHNAHYTMKPVPFSDQNPVEVEMLEWIEKQPVFSAYVKGLIKADMERAKQEEKEENPG